MNLTPNRFYNVYHLSAKLLIQKIQFKLNNGVTVIMTKLDCGHKYHNETIGGDNYNTIMISIYTSVYSISKNSTHRSQNISNDLPAQWRNLFLYRKWDVLLRGLSSFLFREIDDTSCNEPYNSQSFLRFPRIKIRQQPLARKILEV